MNPGPHCTVLADYTIAAAWQHVDDDVMCKTRACEAEGQRLSGIVEKADADK